MSIEIIKKSIAKFLTSELKISIDAHDLVYPENPELGDLSLPTFNFAKELKKSPKDIAENLAGKLARAKLKYVKRVEAKNGYLNFFLNSQALARELLPQVLKSKSKFGDKSARQKSKVLIELVSPNSNKPLHLGHARNAAIGEGVARLLETQGYKVIRANLVNDRGVHICKAMVAYLNYGAIFNAKGKTKKDSPRIQGIKGDHFVGKYYVMYEKKLGENPALEAEAKMCLTKWEQGDKETLKLWKTMRDWALDGFDETYKVLGIKFDRVDYESAIWKEGKEIVMQGLKKKIFTRDAEGAVIADLEKQKLPNKVLLRSDGTSIYITTDIYLAAKRHKEEKFDELIYVVGSEQDLYFKQLFAIFKLLNVPYADKTRHLSYGMVFLPEGKMKSREGTAVDADDLIVKLQEYAAEEVKSRHDFLKKNEVEERARVIALAALKYYLLAVNPPSSMHYDPRESLAFTGKTGPYLLYSLARMKSIIKKARKQESKKAQKHKSKKAKDFHRFLKEKEEWDLILSMAKFTEVIDRAAETFDPEELATYLYNLAKNFSDFYEKHQVLRAAAPVSLARLALVQALAIILKKGLNILGIEMLEEM